MIGKPDVSIAFYSRIVVISKLSRPCPNINISVVIEFPTTFLTYKRKKYVHNMPINDRHLLAYH